MTGFTELLLIILIVLLIYGMGRLPEIGTNLGKSVRNFKKALKGEDEIDVTPIPNGNHRKGKEQNSIKKG